MENSFLASIATGVSQVCVGHPFDTIKVIIQNNNKINKNKLSFFYKGWKFPLTTSVLFNCTVFPVYEQVYFHTDNKFISGLTAGLFVSPIVFISDICKINQQLNKPIKFNTCGLYSTFARETLAMGIYFYTYNTLKEQNVNPLIAGGLAGLFNWAFTYPIDVVKSRQIAQQISIKKSIKQGHLLKGLHICCFRAILVNSTNFYIYENVKKYLVETI